ncbi:hypothetical protein P5W04_07845 [Mycobacteroides abscessus subsp. abscessus]|nr:hypothetical protein [Mycobacteroides abscessus subsp. abscessus]
MNRQPINPDDHHCQFTWCTGTMWNESHLAIEVVDATGRDSDINDGVKVSVVTTFDEDEEPRPRILLHIGDADDLRDVDSCPTVAEARRIAINLLKAADAIEVAR